MTAERLNSETFDKEVPLEKQQPDETEADVELDDEVEKELREFEQLQTGLLAASKPGVENGGRVVEKATVTGNGSGSDMELDDLEEEIAEARNKSINNQTPGKLALSETVPQDIRILPETFAEKNLVGDDLVEKSGIQGNGEKACLDLEKLRDLIDSAKADPLRSPEPNDDDGNDPDFPSPGKRKSRSRRRSKRPKPSRSETKSSPAKRPKTSKSPGTPGASQGEQMTQCHVSFSGEKDRAAGRIQNRSPATTSDPKRGFFDQYLKFKSSEPDPRKTDQAALVGKPTHSMVNEIKTPSFTTLPFKGEGNRVVRAEPSGEQKVVGKTRPLENHVRAIDFDHDTTGPSQPSTSIQQSQPVKQYLNASQESPDDSPLVDNKGTEYKDKSHVEDNSSNSQSGKANTSHGSGIYCVVELILHRKFKNSWTLEKEKLDFLGIDRAAIQCPELYPFVKTYETQEWLVACNELKRFFCWPCLFFAGTVTWYVHCDENTAENMFTKEILKHAQTTAHVESVKQLETFEMQHKPGIIKFLHQKNFDDENWTEKERQAVLRAKPRSRPPTELPSSKYESTALKQFYDKFQWLCSCKNTGYFYCWPCLLFSKDKWCYTDHFSSAENAALQHESSLPHIEACLKLGKLKYGLPKEPEPKKDTEKTSNIVSGIAEILCAEKKKINNNELSAMDLMDTLQLMGEYNKKLRISQDGKSKHSRTSPVLTTSILDSLEFFIRSGIVEEIQSSPFVSLIFDHSSGITGKAVLSVLARYVDTYGQVHERFVKLLNVGYNTPFTTLSAEFFQIIVELQCRSSLVGFTYDGYLVKPGDIPSFNEKVQKFCPNAKFFHYAEHDFKRVLKQTLSHVPVCRRVLQAVRELSHFFETTPSAKKGLMDIVTAAEKSNCNSIWKSPNFITMVFVYHAVIVEIMASICRKSTEYKVRTVVQAKNFLDFFKDSTNRFFVTLMARIFATVEDLAKDLNKEVGTEGLKTISSRAALKIQKLGRNFDNVVESACSHLESTEQEDIRAEMLPLREQFSGVIRLVVKLVKNRVFGMDAGYFKVSKEAPNDSVHFIQLNSPSFFLQSIAVPSAIDSSKLSNELSFFRNSSISSGSDLSQIVADVVKFKMTQALPELFKFLQLALTIPKSLYGNSSTTAVSRISLYVDGKKELNSSDALFWMEKEFLSNLQMDPNFYHRVTDRVASATKKEILDELTD